MEFNRKAVFQRKIKRNRKMYDEVKDNRDTRIVKIFVYFHSSILVDLNDNCDY